jgi:hypothetical protein
MRKKALLFGMIVLGAALGAGVYHVAAVDSPLPPEEKPNPPPAADDSLDMATVRKVLIDIQTRLARLEAKPDFNAALDDPVLRERWASVMVATRMPGRVTPRPAQPGSESWRGEMADRFRADYAKVTAEVKQVTKADEATWGGVQPVLDAHFAPVEAALKDLATGKNPALPDVNGLLAPGLPATLAALRTELSPEAWQAFETWLRVEGPIPLMRAGKGDYFLAGEEYKDYQASRAMQIHWPVLRGLLPQFHERFAMTDEIRTRLDVAMKAHLSRVLGAFRDAPRIDLHSEKGRLRVRAIADKTEPQLAGILGIAGLRAFRQWRLEPGNRAAIYFGEAVAGPHPGTARTPDAGASQPVPAEGHTRF